MRKIILYNLVTFACFFAAAQNIMLPMSQRYQSELDQYQSFLENNVKDFTQKKIMSQAVSLYKMLSERKLDSYLDCQQPLPSSLAVYRWTESVYQSLSKDQQQFLIALGKRIQALDVEAEIGCRRLRSVLDARNPFTDSKDSEEAQTTLLPSFKKLNTSLWNLARQVPSTQGVDIGDTLLRLSFDMTTRPLGDMRYCQSNPAPYSVRLIHLASSQLGKLPSATTRSLLLVLTQLQIMEVQNGYLCKQYERGVLLLQAQRLLREQQEKEAYLSRLERCEDVVTFDSRRGCYGIKNDYNSCRFPSISGVSERVGLRDAIRKARAAQKCR